MSALTFVSTVQFPSRKKKPSSLPFWSSWCRWCRSFDGPPDKMEVNVREIKTSHSRYHWGFRVVLQWSKYISKITTSNYLLLSRTYHVPLNEPVWSSFQMSSLCDDKLIVTLVKVRQIKLETPSANEKRSVIVHCMHWNSPKPNQWYSQNWRNPSILSGMTIVVEMEKGKAHKQVRSSLPPPLPQKNTKEWKVDP